MTDEQTIRLMINLHCRTVIAMIDAADRAETLPQLKERMHIARSTVVEFKDDMTKYFLKKEVA